MTADEIRRRLVEIDDELRALPDDAFAAKHPLRTEQDACRAELRVLVGHELGDMNDHWADRAGRKGTHSVNEDEQQQAAVRVTRGFTSEGQG